VISAEEEAELSLAGVMSALDGRVDVRPDERVDVRPDERVDVRPDERPDERVGEALVFDVGGGSLELISADGGKILKTFSLPAGVVYLTERHLTDVPTPAAQVAACAEDMCGMLHSTALAPPAASLIGCGGTVALAWFVTEGKAGNPGQAGEQGKIGNPGINGVFLKRDEIEAWVDKFAALDMVGRNSLPGFEPGREDIALAGLIVVREILRWGGYETLRVSTGGVREGLLKKLLLAG
jgi:exopolyphosphatase/guanosine-5'-triphosphate,3'-diphosphate pyrophosphatase